MADLTITAASVIPSSTATIKKGIIAAGVTVTAGQLVYVDSNTLKLTDADASAAAAKVSGIAINSGGAGQHINYVIADPKLAIGATVAVGEVYINSDTPGGIRPTADADSGDFIIAVAIGVSTTEVNFKADGLEATVAGVLIARA